MNIAELRRSKEENIRLLVEMSDRPDCTPDLRRDIVAAIEAQLGCLKAIDDGLFVVRDR